MTKIVKRKMTRPSESPPTTLGRRLEADILEVWGSHRRFSWATGIKEGTISNYVRHNRIPAGPELIKIAQALPGRIEYILTGVQAGELDQQTVGTLAPRLRALVHAAMALSADLQETLTVLAQLFSLGEWLETTQALRKTIHAFKALLQVGTEVSRNAPILPPPSGSP